MIDALSSGISALKSAYDLIKVIRDANPNSEVIRLTEQLRSELHTSLDLLLESKSRCLKLADENQELIGEIAKLKQHHIEREQYELYQYPLGSVVYRIKPVHHNEQYSPELCASCFNKGIKSFMQPVTNRRNKALICHECNSEIETEHWPTSDVNGELYRMMEEHRRKKWEGY